MFKTCQTLLIVITATWLSAGHDSASGQWHNSLQPVGKTSAWLTLADNGQTNCLLALHAAHPIIMTFARAHLEFACAHLEIVGHKPQLYDPSWGVTFWIGR